MLTEYLASFTIPAFFALLITPWVIRFALRIGAVDKPGERKIHTHAIPRIGGTGVFLSICFSFIVMMLLFPGLFEQIFAYRMQAAAIVVGFLAIFTLGFWDDLKPLSPATKFGFQFLIASCIYFAGFKISNITNPLGTGMLDVEMIDFPLTLLWIVGITNAFNLIDGLDGLSSGVAAIACISIFMVAAIEGEIFLAVAALTIAGALAGFLRYNFRPARIFLGDSGSLFIGFSLAILSIESTTKISTGMALLFPMLVLGLPITDTLVSMLRRFLSNYLPEKPGISSSVMHKIHGMFTPDRSHIHHRLISLGLTHRSSVIVLYLVSAFFAFFAFAITQIENIEKTYLIALTVGFLLFLGVKKLRYREIAIFNNGMMIPFYERWILNRTTFQVIADLSFISLSFFLSYSLLRSINPAFIEFENFRGVLLIVLLVQASVFWITGIYRETIRQMGIGNALGIISSVIYAVLASTFVLLLSDAFPLGHALQIAVVNFYFLLTCALGLRISWQALGYWFNRDRESGLNVLIYGANENGTMILHQINHSSANHYKVLGFLDDNPSLEGKFIYGYPIFGGHWKLTNSKIGSRVDYIFLCENDIKPENFKRLKKIAAEKEIEIKRLDISLKDIDSVSPQKSPVPVSVYEPVFPEATLQN